MDPIFSLGGLFGYMNSSLDVFYWLQIGMMVVMARQPIDLDQLLNEGVAHNIRMFISRLGELPVGMQPVMIGRRALRYNTVAKVMARLNRVYDISYYMQHLEVMIVNVQ